MKTKKTSRTLWLITLLICFNMKLLAQNQTVGQSYITTVRLTVYSSDVDTSKKAKANTLKKYQYIVNPGTKFTVIDITANNEYLIQFGNYPSVLSGSVSKKESKRTLRFMIDTSSNVTNNILEGYSKSEISTYDTTKAFIGPWANYRTFLILPKDLDSKCTLWFTKSFDFSYGALSLPLKIRFGNGANKYSSFEENLNLGLSAGVKVRIPGVKTM